MTSDVQYSSLVFNGCLPLAWRELPAFPDDMELKHLEQNNLHILNVLFALDIHVGDYGDDPGLLFGTSELKRLDFKVGLILEMVGSLFANQQTVPPERQITLMVAGLSWRTDVVPPPNALLRLELYGNMSYPRPLILHAAVSETLAVDGAYQVNTTFHQPGEPLREALERYIFLRHRRMIANQRGNSQR